MIGNLFIFCISWGMFENINYGNIYYLLKLLVFFIGEVNVDFIEVFYRDFEVAL